MYKNILIRRIDEAYAPLLRVVDGFLKGRYLPRPLDDQNPKELKRKHRLLFYGCMDQWEALRGEIERTLAPGKIFLVAEEEEEMMEALHQDMERYNDLYDEGLEKFGALPEEIHEEYDYERTMLYGLDAEPDAPDSLARIIHTYRPQLLEVCEVVVTQAETLQKKLKGFLNQVRGAIT